MNSNALCVAEEPKFAVVPTLPGLVPTLPEQDVGQAWIVVAAAFFVQVFVLGSVYSFGVFLPFYVC